MAKDFANRRSRSKPANRGAATRNPTVRAAPSRTAAPRNRAPARPRSEHPGQSFFHGPSFSGGVVLGALLVLAGAYLPDIFRDRVAQTLTTKQLESPEPVQFEFDERLRTSEVHTDPDAYADDASQATPGAMEYLIQAASFRAKDDAETLRAQLLLMNLPAHTKAVQVGDKPWYRVTVGPFLSQVEAGRAMTRLRELNLDALLIKLARQ